MKNFGLGLLSVAGGLVLATLGLALIAAPVVAVYFMFTAALTTAQLIIAFLLTLLLTPIALQLGAASTAAGVGFMAIPFMGAYDSIKNRRTYEKVNSNSYNAMPA
jgi:hypothetical protein